MKNTSNNVQFINEKVTADTKRFIEDCESDYQGIIEKVVKRIIEDKKPGSIYENNSLRQDKYLWIAREYQKQGILYTEIADTDLTKPGEPAIDRKSVV